MNQTIDWSGAASCVGELKDGTDALFMMGGGAKTNALDNMVYFSEKKGLVKLPRMNHGPLALATAAYLRPNVYLIGGYNSRDYNDHVYRYNTLTLQWLSTNLPVTGDSFTPRTGLSATVFNGVIATVGGHSGTGGEAAYSNAFEMLEVDRINGVDTELIWHHGPPLQQARAYAAAFTSGCRVYVAGGAIDKDGSKYAEDLNIVEVYSTISDDVSNNGGGNGGGNVGGTTNGFWSRTSNIGKNVSHVNAVTLQSVDGVDQGLLIGGLSKAEPKNYLQPVVQACASPERPVSMTSKDGCDQKRCSDGYVEITESTFFHKKHTCLPCPGVSPDGTCTAACSGGFGGSGTCVLKNKTMLLLAPAPKPICQCKPYYGGIKCEQCLDHRVGKACMFCEKGRTGPMCDACPGLGTNAGVCGGHGDCMGAGSTRTGGGMCECEDGWDDAVNCTKCSDNYFQEEETCERCTCQRTIHNATYAKQCKYSNICSGHGNCSLTPDEKECDCDSGWEGTQCSQSIANQPKKMSAVTVLVILFLSGSFVVGLFFFVRKEMGLDDAQAATAAATQSTSGAYPTAARTNLQGGSGATTLATANHLSEPLLSPGASSGSYAAGSSGNANTAADDLFAKMLAGANNTTPAAAGEVCSSCGKMEGISRGSNFCGLCGMKAC